TGRLNGSVVANQDISFQAMQAKIQGLAAIVKQDPAVANVIAFTGGGGGTTTNTGRVFIALKPLNERDANADQIIARLRPRLTAVPGATLILQSVQDVRIGGGEDGRRVPYG